MSLKSSNDKEILMVTRPITPPWDEASKNFAWELASGLKNQHFHLLTSQKNALNKLPSHVKVYPIYSSSRLRMSFYQKIRLFKFLFQIPKEVQILHYLFTPNPITTILINKMILPFIKKRHITSPIKTIQTIATLDFKKINKQNIAQYLFADLVITHSKYSKDFLNKLNFQNVKQIYPGINLKTFSFRPKKKALLKKFKIDSKEKVILYTGEYSRLNAVDLIKIAFSLVVKNMLNIKLVLACRIKSQKDEEKQKEIKKFFKQNGLINKVIFLETFSPMQDLYNLADLFIFPVKEMTGKFDIALTVIEAMASRVPTILSNIDPLKETSQTENSALFLETITPQELALKIVAVFKNPDLAERLKNGARNNAEKFFDKEQCLKRYSKVYQTL